jgi:hypothetical protein
MKSRRFGRILVLSSMRYNESMPVAAPFYTDEHILAYPIEYIAGIDLTTPVSITRPTMPGRNFGWAGCA